MRAKHRKAWAHRREQPPPWIVILVYVICSIAAFLLFPRLEYRYLADYTIGLSPGSALTICGAIASGMLCLTGIVFSLTFVMVQFSSAAYSPRLVQWLSHDPVISHSTGVFILTFLYALGTAAWVDRGGNGKVPLFSSLFTMVLLVASVFAFTRLIQRLAMLQISQVLSFIGNKGRQVIAETYAPLGEREADDGPAASLPESAPVTQSLVYTGPPRVLAALDIPSLVETARETDGTIVVQVAVGSAIMQGEDLIKVYSAKAKIPEHRMLEAIHLAQERTFEQDPKYALRLLVDLAIKALSPAINDPTTAVQALDQVEDHLRRLGNCRLDVGRVTDAYGVLRLTFPTPAWGDFLLLAFDEIRCYGAGSVQVMRRMRKAIKSIAQTVPPARRPAVERYLVRLDATVGRSYQDPDDRTDALQEDRQGLGLPDHMDS